MEKSPQKKGVLRHEKCHKEFREDREKSSLDSESKGELIENSFIERWNWKQTVTSWRENGYEAAGVDVDAKEGSV